MSKKLKNWKEIPIGGLIVEPGNSKEYLTGDWRTFRPVHIPEKCINCMICWVNCPDSSILSKNGNFDKFDYDHCKGCGICANSCPVKAIEMKPEVDFDE
ncbi:ferredoxin [Candidatus Woesearchaeota archaeon]|nr:MAG: ferredoxin [Candidatus Woesearchaeota archaeon]